MARINFSEDHWEDPRFQSLSRLIGEECAIGSTIRTMMIARDLCGQTWKIPLSLWRCFDIHPALFQCGLVTLDYDGEVLVGSFVRSLHVPDEGGQDV